MSRPSTHGQLLLSTGLHAAAARAPRKTALVCETVAVDYATLAGRVRRVAVGARALGIRRGDRVAILAPNCLEYVELVVGLADAGAIVATLNPRSTAAEVAAACNDCGARVVFAHPASAEVAHGAALDSVERLIVLDDEYRHWRDGSPEGEPCADLVETDPFTLVYSSGTTGRPKGILISHRSRTLTFHGMAMEYGCYGPDDVQLGIAPLAHGAGFAFTMATLFFGGTVQLLAKFDPERVLRRLATEHITGVFMVPAHFQAIFALGETTLGRYAGGAAALRTIMSNAAALPQAMKEKIVGYWGPGRLHELYGATEAGVITSLRPAWQLARPRSVGPAFAMNHVRLLDDRGRDVGTGAEGEVYCRSPYLFNGYWNQPEETAAALRDGWLTVGDIGRMDEHGFLSIVDRKKDMVITGGFNVYPREIEEVLHRHPQVAEAAVVGIADERWGESLEAWIVVRGEATPAAQSLDEHCRQTLSGYKVPKSFRFVAELPRNAAGKVLKTVLRGGGRAAG